MWLRSREYYNIVTYRQVDDGFNTEEYAALAVKRASIRIVVCVRICISVFSLFITGTVVVCVTGTEFRYRFKIGSETNYNTYIRLNVIQCAKKTKNISTARELLVIEKTNTGLEE